MKWTSPLTPLLTPTPIFYCYSRRLRAYCCYLFLLAANGVTEAYVLAAAPPAALSGVNGGYAASSAVYVLAAVPLVSLLRAPGVVAAAGAAMAVRVVSSLRIIYALSCSSVDRSLLPGRGASVAWMALALHGVACVSADWYSSTPGGSALWHVARGCAAALAYCVGVAAAARGDLRFLRGSAGAQ